MKVYAFRYCSCIYESTFSVQSLHITKKGAYKAMRKFLLELWKEHREYECCGKLLRREFIKNNDEFGGGSGYEQYPFLEDESVDITEMEVLND